MSVEPAIEFLDAEVLVIGSGAGGATTGAVLAEAGIDVLVLEEGPWVAQGSVVPFSLEQMDRQYRGGGVTVALGRPALAYTEGRCAGGGTEINSSLYCRPPAEIVERWRRDYAIDDLSPDDLDAIAAEIERDLHVGLLPGDPTAPSAVLRDGAAALGWSSSESPRWMVYPPGAGPARGERQSMTKTFLPRAMAAGARVRTDCRVRRLEFDGGRAVAADAMCTEGGERRPMHVRFRDVFVCGGAIQTPALLQRSGLQRRAGGMRIGHTLAVHPTVKLAARFPDEVNVPDDVPVHQVKEFAPALSFGGSASHPGLVALALTDQWASFAPAVEDWRRISVYYAAITSQGRGRVQAVPGFAEPFVSYHLTARDRDLLRSGLARLALLMLEAGAEEVYPSFRGAPLVRDRRDLADLQDAWSAARASVMTVHLCATVPMGEDRRRCRADSHGLLYGTTNVRVNDAALLPDAPGVNPQGCVMAIAVRNARHFVQEVARRG